MLYHKNKQIFTDIISQAIAKYIQYREISSKIKVNVFLRQLNGKFLMNAYITRITITYYHPSSTMPWFHSQNLPMQKRLKKISLNFSKRTTNILTGGIKMVIMAASTLPFLMNCQMAQKDYSILISLYQLKNGKLFLFDTKTSGSEASVAHLKHNGFIKYAAEQRLLGNTYQGGVIIENHGNWIYSQSKINNTTDHIGWVPFIPRLEIL